MWYENQWHRHLCDMHIEEWSPEFLSEFNPKEYVANLKRANIQNAMIYLQSHVGLCYYPTKIGKVHNAFYDKEDMIKQLIDLCHESGISVTGYYSLIFNNYEHDKHPDWRIVDENGNSARESGLKMNAFGASNGNGRYGFCCPNNKDYREFVLKQVKEISEYFTLDGIFFDMLFWPAVCYCDSCKDRWEKEVGGELPLKNDANWYEFTEKRREWIGEFAMWMYKETKKIMPGVSIEQNFASALQCCGSRCVDERINDACDYAGGDLYGSLYNQSFSCKFYKNISKNQPFEYMTSRCEDLSKHTTLKSFDSMASSIFLTEAHHGATLMIDAIDPKGTLDHRVYDQIGKVFSKVTPYEKFFKGEMVEDVGIYYSLKNKPLDYEPMCNYEGCVLTAETFIKNNVLCGAVGTFKDFQPYKAIVYPCASNFDFKDNERFVQYVENGGNLYFSGVDNDYLLKVFFGAKCSGKTEEDIVYISPKEEYEGSFDRFNRSYPLDFNGKAPIVEGIDSENIIADITLPYTNQKTSKFASIHSNPPGIHTELPAFAFKKFGKGKVLWSALPIECVKSNVTKRLFYKIFEDMFCIEHTISSNAPNDVELLLFKEKSVWQVNAVQLTEDETAKFVKDFNVTLLCNQVPKTVVILPEEKEIEFEYKDGKVSFEIEDLNTFQLVEIKF